MGIDHKRSKGAPPNKESRLVPGFLFLFRYLSWMEKYDVAVIGGGLAGLTTAVHLTREGHKVLVMEKKPYPHHKVCGEYVSTEIMPYLDRLGISLDSLGPTRINRFRLGHSSGGSVTVALPQGGLGLSRWAFDDLLYRYAKGLGADFVFSKAVAIDFEADSFIVKSEAGMGFKVKSVVGCYGKRDGLDKYLGRGHIGHFSPWIGIKAHYHLPDFPDDLVALHDFPGGYAGLSKVEGGRVNFCSLVSYPHFKESNGVEGFLADKVTANPFLSRFLETASPIFERPMAIAQIAFGTKRAVHDHVLMCGDTAGVIHPLCGNGMAMAIHAAKMAGTLVHRFLTDPGYDRATLETDYARQWRLVFRERIWIGQQLQNLFLRPRLSKIALRTVMATPGLLRIIISRTHGKPVF